MATFHLGSKENAKMTERLRAEITTAPRPLGWHKLEQLPYLTACIKEAMRLAHGVMVPDPRLVDETMMYKDWVIPPRTPVSMTTALVLMNETVFPNLKEFIPERWIGRPDLERYFVPFGYVRKMFTFVFISSFLWITVLLLAFSFLFNRFLTIKSRIGLYTSLYGAAWCNEPPTPEVYMETYGRHEYTSTF